LENLLAFAFLLWFNRQHPQQQQQQPDTTRQQGQELRPLLRRGQQKQQRKAHSVIILESQDTAATIHRSSSQLNSTIQAPAVPGPSRTQSVYFDCELIYS